MALMQPSTAAPKANMRSPMPDCASFYIGSGNDGNGSCDINATLNSITINNGTNTTHQGVEQADTGQNERRSLIDAVVGVHQLGVGIGDGAIGCRRRADSFGCQRLAYPGMRIAAGNLARDRRSPHQRILINMS